MEIWTVEFFLMETECVQTFMHVFMYAGRVHEQKQKPSHPKNKNMQEKQAKGGGAMVYVDKNGQPIAQGPITALCS